jgi:uracil-DNA glycosylase family 4
VCNIKQTVLKVKILYGWEELQEKCRGCTGCALHETRTKVVFGVGNPEAEVMLVGEGPGENEDLQGEPFVGRAGKLLDNMLEIINLDRTKNVYITNMVKCRPPKNRNPLNVEREACDGWLQNQFMIIKPKIIVCVGRIAAGLIKDDFKITQEHGKWFEKDGIKYFAIFHPAALLRDPRRRPETFEDLKELERVIKETCENTY